MSQPTTHHPREQQTDPHRLGRAFLKNHATDSQGRRTLHFWRGEWWRWDSGRYAPVASDEFRAQVTQALKEYIDTTPVLDASDRTLPVRGSLVSNVCSALMGLTLVPGNVDQPAWLETAGQAPHLTVAMLNGLVDIEAATTQGSAALQPHTPRWFSPIRLPYAFDPSAKCPRFLAFLEEVLENDLDRIHQVQEWAGYLLTPDCSFHKMLFLEGSGRNGKSVLLETLTALVGADNVSNVPLELFGERFQITPTLGKLANICTETDGGKLPEGIIKQFVAGEPLQFDRKGRSPVQARPTARVIGATNNPPQVTDRSNGLWSRLEMIPFRVTIPPERQDRDLVNKLRAELSGIFNWALLGRHRLYTENHFTESKVSREWVQQYRDRNTPEKDFLLEHYEVATEGSVPKEQVYNEYRQWADANGVKPVLSALQFSQEVKRLFPMVSTEGRPVVDGRRQRVYGGLRFVVAEDLELSQAA